jgi:hypothetical protein
MANKTRMAGGSSPAPTVRRPATRQSYRPPQRGTPRPLPRRPGDRPASATVQRDDLRLQLIIGALTILAIAAGVTVWNLWPREHPPRAACVVAIDAQGSSGPQVPNYRKWLPGQLSRCAKASRALIDVMLINGETSTSPVLVDSLDLSKLDFVGDPIDDGKIIDQAIKNYSSSAMDKILQAPNSSIGTDLVATGCAARPQLKGVKNTLIVFSDGDNSRPPLVFGKKDTPMDDASIPGYIDRLRNSGQICDLSGATVDWYGANVGGGADELHGILGQIQKFWSAYFTASNAHLVEYQAGP